MAAQLSKKRDFLPSLVPLGCVPPALLIETNGGGKRPAQDSSGRGGNTSVQTQMVN
jgi:hypothetical protein